MQPHLPFDQWTKEFEEGLSAEERNLPSEVIQAMLVAYLIKKANQRMAIADYLFLNARFAAINRCSIEDFLGGVFCRRR
jgi:hypothetical protein